jgi:hypothetical protein
MQDCPLAQAEDFFPTLIAWHIFMTSGSNEMDPKLRWAVDHCSSITVPILLENNTNIQQDLNILSNLRTHASNKRIKLTHLTTELIIKIG